MEVNESVAAVSTAPVVDVASSAPSVVFGFESTLLLPAVGWTLLAIVLFPVIRLLYRCFCVDYYRLYKLDPSLPVLEGSSRGWLGVVTRIDPRNAYRAFTQWALERRPVMAFVLFGEPIVLVSDPEVAKQVLTHPNSREKSLTYEILKVFLGEHGLVSAKDDVWKRQRKLLSSVFHYHNIDNFLNIFIDSSTEMVQILCEKAAAKPFEAIEIDSIATNATLDVISRAMFTKHFNIQRDTNSQFPEAMRCGALELEHRFTNPFHHLNLFAQLKFRRSTRFLRSVLDQVLKEKRSKLQANVDSADAPRSRDLVDLMMQARSPDKDEPLTDDEIYSQFVTFFFAGHDTTSHTIAWVCHELAMYPEIERRVLAELDDIMGPRTAPTIGELGRMKYLQCVIKETLRLHPPVPQISRHVAQDFELSVPVAPGSSEMRSIQVRNPQTLTVSISSIHLDPVHWPNPQQFDPDRFTDERSANRHPFAWIPFSNSDKHCIGQQFALLEIKCFIAMLFKRLSFAPDRLRPPTSLSKTTMAPDAVYLFVSPRS